jgi:hypothetical protein
MASRNPDFAALATLTTEAYDAADRALIHVRLCDKCDESAFCAWGKSLMSNYNGLKKKALKALRGKPRALGTDNDRLVRGKK